MIGAALAAVPFDAASELEKTAACGPAGQQAWLCTSVYDLTGSQRAAEVADDLSTPFKVLVIILVAYLLVRIARLVIKRVVRRLTADASGDKISKLKQRTGLALLDTSPIPSVRRALRAETIGAVLRSIVAALIWATAGIMILDEIGVNLAAIGLGASIIGVAIGFGSQSLVRDFLSGIFMLVEDQYGVGDVIDVGEATGTVEGVSLRTTRLRDAEGTVWHVPNGEIRRVGNKSQQWSRAVLDVAIAYDADLDRATEIIKTTADGLWQDPEFRGVVLGEPEVWGVELVTSEQLLVRLAVKTRPLEQWRVSRELRARLKRALDAAGIARTTGSVVEYRTRDSGPPGADG
jgi:small conductance mechanosensitive channel